MRLQQGGVLSPTFRAPRLRGAAGLRYEGAAVHADSILVKALKSPALWLLLFLSVFLPAMSLTGRYGGVPHYDLLWDTMNAHRLVTEGTIPVHGCVSSLYSFNPPGISFGMAPGIAVFPHRPVAAERFGAALLFVGTLWGLFLLVYPRLGGWAASASILLFSMASGGAFFLTTLWPRGHAFFAVWMILFSLLWAERRRSRWLCAALFTYAAGMYWFMEIAPAILIVAAVFVVYRPPVGWKAPLSAAVFSLLLWFPYLRFEAGRDFADLRSLLLVSAVPGDRSVARQVSDPSHELVRSWEVPARRAHETGGKLERPVDEENFWLWSREWGWVWAERKVVKYLGEDGFIFYCPPRSEWVFQGFASGRILRTGHKEWEPGSFLVDYPGRETRAVAGRTDWRIVRERLKTAGPLLYLGEQQNFGLWLWQALLFVFAALLVVWKGAFWKLPGEVLRRWRGLASRNSESAASSGDRGRMLLVILFLSWLLPVLFLFALVGWEGLWQGQRRFLWLWAVQAPLLGAALSLPLFRGWRLLFPLALAAAFTLSLNPLTRSLFADAFSAEPGHFQKKEDKAIDAISDVVRASGRSSARIGYDTNQLEWLVQLRSVDGISKCGIDWDVSLYLRHGIVNLDTSAEGLSADDDFRVFSPLYNIPRSNFAQNRWSMTIDGSLPEMEKLAEVEGYEILGRPGK